MRNVLLAPSPIAAHRPFPFVIRQMAEPPQGYPIDSAGLVSLCDKTPCFGVPRANVRRERSAGVSRTRRGGGIAHGLPDRPAAIGLSLSFRIMVATPRNVRMGVTNCAIFGDTPLRKSRVVFLNTAMVIILAMLSRV